MQVVDRVEHYDHISRHRFVSTYRYRHGFYDAEEREFRGFGYVEQRDTESVGGDIGRGLFPTYPVENGEMPQPPVVTKTWFHTGAWQQKQKLFDAYEAEWFDADGNEPRLSMPAMPAGLSPVELHQAHRALAGTTLRQEIYAEDGSADADKPYLVSQSTFAVRREQPCGEAPYAVFLTHPSESLSLHYERNTTDPRMAHELVLEVDGFGRVARSASVGYGRGTGAHPEQETTWITASQQAFYDIDNATGDYRHSIPRWSKSWELAGALTKTGTLYAGSELLGELNTATQIRFDVAVTTGNKRLLSHTRQRYWKNDVSAALDYGEIEAKALPYETYALALTAEMLSDELNGVITEGVAKSDGKYKVPGDIAGFSLVDGDTGGASTDLWASTGHATFDASSFYLVNKVTDVFGTSTNVTYDSEKLFVTATTLDLSSPLNLSTTAEIDYRVLGPKKVTDINGNHTRALFDALGRVIETAVGGAAGEGDKLSTDPEPPTNNGPTTEITYGHDEWQTNEKPTWVKTRVREKHDDAATTWIESYAYANGSGAVVLTKVQAEDGLAPEKDQNGQVVLDGNGDPVLIQTSPRWVGTGRTVVDNKGNPIKQYEPYFSDTEAYDEDEVFADWGVTPLLHYDPLGRLIRTDLPDGSTSRVEFSPWMQKSYDRNDTTGEVGNLWYADKSGHSDAWWQDAASKAVAHSYNDATESLNPGVAGDWGTPTTTHFDALGRAYAVVEHNRDATPNDVLVATKSLLDVQGNVLSVVDALDRTCMKYAYGVLGQVLRLTSLDAGRRYMFDAVNGQAVKMWGERGASSGQPYFQRVVYDALRRPTEIWLNDDGTEREIQALTYGEGHVDASTKYLKGRLIEHRDQSGVVTTAHYDFKGNLLSQTRQLVTAYQGIVDWSGSPTLETETFEHSFSYDALNRPTSTITPDLTEVLPTYNKAGLLERVEAKVRGASTATVFVDDIDYDEKGRRTKITYSDTGGSYFFTEYTYDPLTYRLEHFKTKRTSDNKLLQSLAYYYDPVGNITHTKDTQTDDIYFTTTETLPTGDGDYTYDALYRLIAATGREHEAFGGYTDEGDPTELDIPHADPQNDIGLREYEETYTYDAVGNLVTMHHAPLGGTAWTRNYNYVTYDGLHPDFPNVESNRLDTTDDNGSPPAYRSYSHDAHGNMASMPHLDSLAWDYADQLGHVEKTTGQDVYFVTDASGQRVRKVYLHGQYRDETLYLGGFEVYRRYDNGVLKEERETVHVSDDARRICMVETVTLTGGVAVGTPSPELRFQLDNHLGTVGVEVDPTGAVISYEEYFPYGGSALRSWDGSLGVSKKRHRYNGKERDEATGLYYYGARYYAPWLGRWTAADPLAFADGVGSYTYVRGSPVVLSDPTGKASADQWMTRFQKMEQAKWELISSFGKGGPTKEQTSVLNNILQLQTEALSGAKIAQTLSKIEVPGPPKLQQLSPASGAPPPVVQGLSEGSGAIVSDKEIDQLSNLGPLEAVSAGIQTYSGMMMPLAPVLTTLTEAGIEAATADTSEQRERAAGKAVGGVLDVALMYVAVRTPKASPAGAATPDAKVGVTSGVDDALPAMTREGVVPGMGAPPPPPGSAPGGGGTPRYVYRGGSDTPNNLTPRPGVDTKGLSTFDTLEGAVGPGGKAQKIDLQKLADPLVGVPDAPPPGHVSIRPGVKLVSSVLKDIEDWAATRGTGSVHPYTQQILDAIVETVRRPKQ